MPFPYYNLYVKTPFSLQNKGVFCEIELTIFGKFYAIQMLLTLKSKLQNTILRLQTYGRLNRPLSEFVNNTFHQKD